MMPEAIWVAVGGAAGSVLRYGLGAWCASRFGTGFPVGTLLVNVLACFLLGVFVGSADAGLAQNIVWHSTLVVGFLGALSTFSSFSMEAVALFQAGRGITGCIYVLSSVVLCFGGCILGRGI